MVGCPPPVCPCHDVWQQEGAIQDCAQCQRMADLEEKKFPRGEWPVELTVRRPLSSCTPGFLTRLWWQTTTPHTKSAGQQMHSSWSLHRQALQALGNGSFRWCAHSLRGHTDLGKLDVHEVEVRFEVFELDWGASVQVQVLCRLQEVTQVQVQRQQPSRRIEVLRVVLHSLIQLRWRDPPSRLCWKFKLAIHGFKVSVGQQADGG